MMHIRITFISLLCLFGSVPQTFADAFSAEQESVSTSALPFDLLADRARIQSDTNLFIQARAFEKTNGEKVEVFQSKRFGGYEDFTMFVIDHPRIMGGPHGLSDSTERIFRFYLEAVIGGGQVGFDEEFEYSTLGRGSTRYWNGFFNWQDVNIGRTRNSVALYLKGDTVDIPGLHDGDLLKAWENIDEGMMIEVLLSVDES